MSCESKSLFPGVCWHKSWLAVTDRGLYRETEDILLLPAVDQKRQGQVHWMPCNYIKGEEFMNSKEGGSKI